MFPQEGQVLNALPSPIGLCFLLVHDLSVLEHFSLAFVLTQIKFPDTFLKGLPFLTAHCGLEVLDDILGEFLPLGFPLDQLAHGPLVGRGALLLDSLPVPLALEQIS